MLLNILNFSLAHINLALTFAPRSSWNNGMDRNSTTAYYHQKKRFNKYYTIIGNFA